MAEEKKLRIKTEKDLKLERMILENKPTICDECGGKMFYIGGGQYECEKCGYKALDDFGRVKGYIDEHGPSSAVIISEETGVKMEVIDVFLRQGRVEIPEGSRYYLKCKKCGCSLKYGRYCPDCAKELAGSIKAVFNAEVGERPKHEGNPDMKGKMRFSGRE